MNNWQYLAIAISTVSLSYFTVLASQRVAKKFSLVDKPDGERKLQQNAIPKIGGAAVIVTFSLVLTVVAWQEKSISAVPLLWVLAPALAAGLVGLVDDFKPLKPTLRLILISVLAGLVWWQGTTIGLFENQIISFVVTLLWFLAITNSLNMIDNTDGLAGLVTVISSIGIFLVAWSFGQFLVASLAIALAGIAIGFLLHNWHPASIYLGDAGAYFFGFMLAILSIRLKPTEADPLVGSMIPLLLLIYPLTDLWFVVARRLADKKHPFTAGRDHISHTLISTGLGTRSTVLLIAAYHGLGVAVAVLVGLAVAI
jgi:UDP-GlcNAc:undecaprenyl-phosphate GlcNAc-1-phosphate transferase